MTFDPNNVTQENQPGNRLSQRLRLKAGDTIKGLVEPGTTEPEGILVKGPFDNNPWTVKMLELAGVLSDVKVQATYDLDYVELTIDAAAGLGPYPNRTFVDAAPTWEDVVTFNLVGLGKDAKVIDWGALSLSKPGVVPSAVRFLFDAGGNVGKDVKIEVEEGIL